MLRRYATVRTVITADYVDCNTRGNKHGHKCRASRWVQFFADKKPPYFGVDYRFAVDYDRMRVTITSERYHIDILYFVEELIIFLGICNYVVKYAVYDHTDMDALRKSLNMDFGYDYVYGCWWPRLFDNIYDFHPSRWYDMSRVARLRRKLQDRHLVRPVDYRLVSFYCDLKRATLEEDRRTPRVFVEIVCGYPTYLFGFTDSFEDVNFKVHTVVPKETVKKVERFLKERGLRYDFIPPDDFVNWNTSSFRFLLEDEFSIDVTLVNRHYHKTTEAYKCDLEVCMNAISFDSLCDDKPITECLVKQHITNVVKTNGERRGKLPDAWKPPCRNVKNGHNQDMGASLNLFAMRTLNIEPPKFDRCPLNRKLKERIAKYNYRTVIPSLKEMCLVSRYCAVNVLPFGMGAEFCLK